MIPNLVVAAPRDENELRACSRPRSRLGSAVRAALPARRRDRRAPLDPDPKPLPIGRGELLRDGERSRAARHRQDGSRVALRAAELARRPRHLRLAVVDARFVKPLDADAVRRASRAASRFVRHASKTTPARAASAARCSSCSPREAPGTAGCGRLGLGDRFLEHADMRAQWRAARIDPESVADDAALWLARQALRRARAAASPRGWRMRADAAPTPAVLAAYAHCRGLIARAAARASPRRSGCFRARSGARCTRSTPSAASPTTSPTIRRCAATARRCSSAGARSSPPPIAARRGIRSGSRSATQCIASTCRARLFDELLRGVESDLRSGAARDLRRRSPATAIRVASTVGSCSSRLLGHREPARARLRRGDGDRGAAHQHPARRGRGRGGGPDLSRARGHAPLRRERGGARARIRRPTSCACCSPAMRSARASTTSGAERAAAQRGARAAAPRGRDGRASTGRCSTSSQRRRFPHAEPALRLSNARRLAIAASRWLGRSARVSELEGRKRSHLELCATQDVEHAGSDAARRRPPRARGAAGALGRRDRSRDGAARPPARSADLHLGDDGRHAGGRRGSTARSRRPRRSPASAWASARSARCCSIRRSGRTLPRARRRARHRCCSPTSASCRRATPGPRAVAELVEAIGADALCVHLNPAQELVQDEGDRDFRGGLGGDRRARRRAARFRSSSRRPAAGFGPRALARLRDAGVRGSTSRAPAARRGPAVEALRGSARQRALGLELREWGIPTAASVVVRAARAGSARDRIGGHPRPARRRARARARRAMPWRSRCRCCAPGARRRRARA